MTNRFAQLDCFILAASPVDSPIIPSYTRGLRGSPIDMGKIAEWFDLTAAQSKVIVGLALLSFILASFLFIRTYTTAAREAPDLPVFVADPDTKFTGIFVLDPNTAPADSLELLPGVGNILADRIVEYRATHRFQREIDITEVKGFGAKLYEKIRPYLKVTTP